MCLTGHVEPPGPAARDRVSGDRVCNQTADPRMLPVSAVGGSVEGVEPSEGPPQHGTPALERATPQSGLRRGEGQSSLIYNPA